MSYRADDQLSHQEYKRESMQKLKENHSELLSNWRTDKVIYRVASSQNGKGEEEGQLDLLYIQY